MNDALDEFESELSRLRPRHLSTDVIARIGAALDAPALRRSFADRCLLSFIGGGALAASVIVCLIGWQVLEDRHPSVSSTAIVNASPPPPPSIAAYRQALARSDGPTLELLR